MTLVEQLKERYPIQAMVDKLGIGEGRRGAKILCPFHDDTNPSLHLFFDSDRWQCFVCDIGGDQLDLYAQVHDVPLVTAFQMLADIEGIDTSKVEWAALKPKPPSDAELLLRVCYKAELEVLRALAVDYEEARGKQSWVSLVDAAFQPYDELRRRYRAMELGAGTTTELVLIWWRWASGQEPYGSDLRRLWTVLGDPRAEVEEPKPTSRRSLAPSRRT